MLQVTFNSGVKCFRILIISVILATSCKVATVKNGVYVNNATNSGFPDAIVVDNGRLFFTSISENGCGGCADTSLVANIYGFKHFKQDLYKIERQRRIWNEYTTLVSSHFDRNGRSDSIDVDFIFEDSLTDYEITLMICSRKFNDLGDYDMIIETFNVVDNITHLRLPNSFKASEIHVLLRYSASSLPAHNRYFAPVQFFAYFNIRNNVTANHVTCVFREFVKYLDSPSLMDDYMTYHDGMIEWHGTNYEIQTIE